MSDHVSVASNVGWLKPVKTAFARRPNIFMMRLLKLFDLCWDRTTIQTLSVFGPTANAKTQLSLTRCHR